MIIDVFDLNGKKEFYRFSDQTLTHKIPLRELLIYPKNHPNKEPYLQDPEHPLLEDIFLPDNQLDYSNCFFLNGMLTAGKVQADHLHDYFRYQNPLLPDANEADTTIILVPDHYDLALQEQILRSCDRPRHKTFLLWRSVAACIGSREELQRDNAHAGQTVSVIDIRDIDVGISVLTLADDSGILVPARSAFYHGTENKVRLTKHKKHYPVSSDSIKDDTAIPNTLEAFWRHTTHRYGTSQLMFDGTFWGMENIPERKQSYSHSFCESDFCIVTNKITILRPKPTYYIADNENLLLAKGAAMFALAQANGTPTYYDEVESLNLIVQNKMLECIEIKEQIPGNEWCRGGKRIEGKPNMDCYLDAQNASIEQLMSIGDTTEKTPLRSCTHKFPEITQKQTLTLYSSITPGQGFARITADARPLIPDLVEVNSAMDIAKDGNGNIKTIESLEKNLKRSFPIDMPAVQAKIPPNLVSVWDYLLDGQLWDSGLFAQSVFPCASVNSMQIYGFKPNEISCFDRFRRYNVFGNDPQEHFPDENIIPATMRGKLFRKMYNDYGKSISESDDGLRLKIIRLVAWTYQQENPLFQDLITDTLAKIRRAANGVAVGLQGQEFTVCANMLSLSQQGTFISYFNKYVYGRIKACGQQQITKIDNWLRALSELLMYNNDCLKNVDSATCEVTAERLYQVLISYIFSGKRDKYIRPVLKGMLFLLKRRKYDKQFLTGNSKIFQLFEKLYDDCALDYSTTTWFEYLETQNEFLHGNGTLESIPIGD